MNSVYNFGHIFDNIRDLILYFNENPRGQTNSVHDAGYNAGIAVYYFITPEIAFYESWDIDDPENQKKKINVDDYND